MEPKANHSQMEPARVAFPTRSEPLVGFDWTPSVPPRRKSVWSDLETLQSLENTATSLASSYLAANQSFEGVPLKEFMDGIEKRILLSCLRLTHGHQRNAAAILGLKPTALFEKMRKHCINCRKIKLSDRLTSEAPEAAK